MGYILRDFKCESTTCSQPVWEELVDRKEENDQKCPTCSGPAKYTLCAPALATYSLMSKDDQAKHLRKRSRDHTRKELKKDPTAMKMSRHIKMKGSK